MSCANSVLPVFMAKSSPPDRRGEPPPGQIGTSNNQPKTLTCQRLPGNLGSANRTAMMVYSEVILPPVTFTTDYFGFSLGAYTSDGQPLVDFRLRRERGTETVDPEFPENCKRMDVAATY